MGRPVRVQPPGETFHITARGVRRGLLFLDDIDYLLYLRLLGQTSKRFGWVVLAYGLMPNHVHLLVRLLEATLSAGVHRQHGLFAKRVNERHAYSGHVFEARFHSVLIESEEHLLEVVRYIPLNAPRAGLCERPEDWTWASHRAVVGLAGPWSPVEVSEVRSLFGEGPAGISRYVAFVEAGLRTAA